MQRPTASNIRIRSTRDAHLIFHAVALGVLPMITRRLDADERLALRSGAVYAWEERGPHTEVTGLGIERFTEGRRWGPSRVRDEFLFYYEKCPPTDYKDKDNPDWESQYSKKHWDPLVKQTYSVWVDSPNGRRKWHLTAYFTQATVDQLSTVDDMPELRGIDVPQGRYNSTRTGKSRRPDEPRAGTSAIHDVFRPPNVAATRTYAPFPLPYADAGARSPPGHPPFSPRLDDRSAVPHGAAHTWARSPPDSGHGMAAYTHSPPISPERTLSLPPIRAPASLDNRSYSEYYAPHDYPSPHERGSPPHSQALPPHSSPVAKSEHQPHQPLRSAYYPPTPPSTYYPANHVSPQGFINNSQYPPQAPYLYPSRPPHLSQDPYPSPYPLSSSASHPSFPPTPPSHPTSHHQPSYAHHWPHPSYTQGPPTPPATESKSPSPTAQLPTPTETHNHTPSPPAPWRTLPLVLPPLSAPVSDVRDDLLQTPPRSGKGVGLAPLRSLQRPHPYRRDEFDDRALRAFNPR